MEVNNKQDYELEEYKFVNFTNLDDRILEQIRIWRNHPDIRKFMYNSNEIGKEEHFKFVKSLPQRNDKFYWLVFRNNQPLGIINIIDFNSEEASAENGYYIIPDRLKEANGLEFIFAVNNFLFNIIGLLELHGRTEISNINAMIINKIMGSKHNNTPVNIDDKKYIEFVLKAKDFNKVYPLRKDLTGLAKLSLKYKKDLKNLINEIKWK